MTDSSRLIKMDGYNDAMIGRCVRFNTEFDIYDYDKVILLLQREGMTKGEAEEYWQSHMVGGWVGEQTPAFLIRENKGDDNGLRD